jgi:hypothetical protein
MNLLLPIVGIFIACLIGLLLWSARRSSGPNPASLPRENLNFVCQHLDHLSQLRQALAGTDISLLMSRGQHKLAQKITRERRQIALRYLESVRLDFEGLLRTAKAVAILSPEVMAADEWERMQLSAHFFWRYQILKLRLRMGSASFSQLGNLSKFVSKLSVEMERAVAELAERAVLVAENASLPQR